jgi:hypothetical protein
MIARSKQPLTHKCFHLAAIFFTREGGQATWCTNTFRSLGMETVGSSVSQFNYLFNGGCNTIMLKESKD